MMFHYDNQVVLCLNRTRAWTHRGDEGERFNSSSVLKTRSLPTFVLLIESVLRQIWEFSDPVVCENFSKAHWMNGRIQGRQAHTVPGKMTCHTYSELVGRRTHRRSICLQLLFVSPVSCSVCRHHVDSGLILCIHVTTRGSPWDGRARDVGSSNPNTPARCRPDCAHSISESGNQRRSLKGPDPDKTLSVCKQSSSNS